MLLRVDAAAAVAVLGEAVSGWDAVETDLRAAAGKPAEELDSVLVASQVRLGGRERELLPFPPSTFHLSLTRIYKHIFSLSLTHTHTFSHAHLCGSSPPPQVLVNALVGLVESGTLERSVGRKSVERRERERPLISFGEEKGEEEALVKEGEER